MEIKEITKTELFKLLGINEAETKNIGQLSMHIPEDQDTNKFIFNYEFVEETPENV